MGVRLKIPVKLIHGCFQAFAKEAEDSFAHPGHDLSHNLFFLGGEIAEDIGNNVSLTDFGCCWSSNAYPKAREVLASQFGDGGANPFVSTRATTLTKADFTQGEVKVIMDDEEVVGAGIELTYQSAN